MHGQTAFQAGKGTLERSGTERYCADAATDIEHSLMIGHSDQAVFASLGHFTYSFTWKIIKMDGFNEKKWFVYLTDHHEGPVFAFLKSRPRWLIVRVTTANYVCGRKG